MKYTLISRCFSFGLGAKYTLGERNDVTPAGLNDVP